MISLGIQFVLLAVVVAIMTAAGWFIGRNLAYNGRVLSAGLTLAGMLLFARYLADSLWVAQVIPPDFIIVFGNFLPPLAGLLAGLGWTISARPTVIKSVVLGLFLLTSMVLPYRALFAERPVVHDFWVDGIARQTTDATCAPAAAATALSMIGINTTEPEMVDLCLTTNRGTGFHSLVYGIHVKLSGSDWRVKPTRLTREELDTLKFPAILFVGIDVEDDYDPMLVFWGWQPGVVHTVVFQGLAAQGGFHIADPSTGREIWNEAALAMLWKGQAIVLVPR